jgi:acyl-CoA synthetase (NDP forming)
MLEAARPYLLRVLGPNCVGLLVPGIGLNASFAHTGAKDAACEEVGPTPQRRRP